MIVGQASPKFCNVGGGRDQRGAGSSIEPNERTHDAVKLPAPEAAVGDCLVEHLGLVEAPHDHEPIDNFAAASDREAAFRMRQRGDIQINVRSKTTIELELGPACGLAALKRGEIEIRKTNRLFQLIGPIAGEKYQRHMGFAARYLGNEPIIAVDPLQKGDFIA